MHRIECVPCGNRAFSNREALQQHLKTSSAYHPHCEKCDKRFSSESGLDAHMAAKHPPTFDCARCSRSYRHLFALEDHYRGSPYHPNCSRCGKGFKDDAELEEHRQTAHIQRPCTPCGGELVYQDQDSLERHYVNSDRHSKCTECNKGFRDAVALRSHANMEHSPSTPSPPQTPSLEPSIAPSPPRPEIPSKDALTTSPTALMNHAYSSGLATSPSPKSGKLFKEFTPFAPRRMESPDLSRLSLSFGGAGSPLLAIQPPPFSPAGLIPPGREANELWNSKMNVQVPSPLNSTKPTVPVKTSPTLSRSRFSMVLDCEKPLTRAADPPATSSGVNGAASSYNPPSRFGFRPMLSRPAASLPTLPSSSISRLEDGTQLASSSQASAAVSQYPLSRQYTSPPRMPVPAVNVNSNPSSSLTSVRDLPPAISSHLAAVGNGNATTPLTISSRLRNELPSAPGSSLNHNQVGSEAYALTLRNLLSDADDHNATLEDCDSETPNVARSPEEEDDHTIVALCVDNTSGTEFPPLSSASTFSFSNLEEASLPFAHSESLSLEVIDQIAEDSPWPESKLPLPTSLPGSPAPLGGLPPGQPPAHSTASTLIPEAPTTTGIRDGLRTPISLINSPETTFFTPGPVVDTGLLDHEGQEKSGNSCLIAKGHYEDHEPPIPNDLTPTEPKGLSPLHCRSCKADSCKEITATMCGHIFCNSCIVDAVIKTSKCPFCSTPTLLYCLFKLHL